MTTVAEILAQRFFEAGCRFAFGIPGGEVLTVLDALHRAGLRFILTKQENAAGYMAEGVYSVTGAPGILLTTLGPGVANAATVVANAGQDRVPLLVLTGCVDDADVLTYPHQIFDHAALFAPITKASFRVSGETAGIVAEKALALATGARPGPVHIDIPVSAAAQELAAPPPYRYARPGPVTPAPCQTLDTAKTWLEESRRPLLMAGLDVLHQGGGSALRGFCERFHVPVITSYKAKGVIPEDHPLSLGGAGLSPTADRHLRPLLDAADLLLLVGYDPIEMRTGWRNAWDPRSQRVIEFTAAANDHFMHHASMSFVCDVGEALARLGEGVQASETWPAGEPSAARRALAAVYRRDEAWGPAAVVDTARKCMARDGIATVDSGAHRILLTQIWQSFRPRTLLQSAGLGAMGCALPLAIGAKLAAPERQVLCFTGDAGLEMILGELATLRDLRLPIPVIVFADASLALIDLKQRAMGLNSVGVHFGGTDFAALGRAFGGRGAVATGREELTDALRAAFAADTFTVVACPVDARAYDGRI